MSFGGGAGGPGSGAGMPDGFTPPAGGMPDAPAGFPGSDGKAPAAPTGVATGAKASVGDTPVAIIVSAKDGSDFDAGLATEMMTVEAAPLGYGIKIVSSPTMVLNGANKTMYQEMLGIPSDMSVKAVLLIGKAADEKTDASSGATARNAEKDVVTYIK